jgi:hypothetical protein
MDMSLAEALGGEREGRFFLFIRPWTLKPILDKLYLREVEGDIDYVLLMLNRDGGLYIITPDKKVKTTDEVQWEPAYGISTTPEFDERQQEIMNRLYAQKYTPVRLVGAPTMCVHEEGYDDWQWGNIPDEEFSPCFIVLVETVNPDDFSLRGIFE